MSLSRLITGGILVIIGIFLSLISVFYSGDGSWVALIYGLPILVIGTFILLNKNEDKIEQIKSVGGKK